jgi:hypothetical protein
MKYLFQPFCLLTLLAISFTAFAQSNDDYLYWSATRRLTTNDFAIKTSDLKTAACFALQKGHLVKNCFEKESTGLQFEFGKVFQ